MSDDEFGGSDAEGIPDADGMDGRQHLNDLDDGCKRKLTSIDRILSISVNWPTNYNFALFSKLPTNYTKISDKIHFTYQNAPLRGAFYLGFFVFFLKCLCNLLVK